MEYRASGKLLLTAEYAVLQGAQALALPVKFGQTLLVEESNDDYLTWEAYENDKLWFSAKFSLDNFNVIHTDNNDNALYAKKILEAIYTINPELFTSGYTLTHKLDFNRNWGLGSSSTLISNMAQWSGIDPFELHFAVSNGSGYDIACARAQKPLLYQVVNKQPQFEEVTFKPPFFEKLYFAYLGRKMATENNVSSFLAKKKLTTNEIDKITALTREIQRCNKFEDIGVLLFEHEQFLSSLLEKEPVKKSLFSDFPGAVKSLGAWGGDFVLIVYNGERENLKKYLHSKNISTFFRFDEIILA